MSVSQKVTLPLVEAETAAKGDPLSSSVEMLVDSAPVIKDRKVEILLLYHQSINIPVFRCTPGYQSRVLIQDTANSLNMYFSLKNCWRNPEGLTCHHRKLS